MFPSNESLPNPRSSRPAGRPSFSSSNGGGGEPLNSDVRRQASGIPERVVDRETLH